MRFLITLLLLSTSIISTAQHQEKAFLIGDLLETANQQRMLTQKVAKIYTAIYISSSDITSYRIELNQAIKQFEQQNAALQQLKINFKYHQLIDNIAVNWDEYISLISERPSKENLLQLLEHSNDMLSQCNTLVEELTEYALHFSKKHQTTGIHYDIIQLENTAGHQRMLSQRILFYYLAYQAIIEEDSEIKTILDNSLAAYETTLHKLMTAPLNSPEIDYRLRLLSKEWASIRTHYQNKVKDLHQIEKLLQQDNNLLSSMNTITELYSTLVDQQTTTAFFENAIDMANQQSVLTQQMTESYILAGRMPEQRNHIKNINQQIEQFEYHIDELKLFAPAEEITNALNKVDLLWTDYRNELLIPSTQKGAQNLLAQNQALLSACKHVTELLSLYAKLSQKHLNHPNRNLPHWLQKLKYQKVLAARILMYSQAILWNINSNEQNIKEIETAGYAFIDNLHNLNLHLNDQAIQLQIQTLIQNWGQVKPHINAEEPNKDVLQEWASHLPEQIDEMVLVYEDKINQIVAHEAIEIINHQALLSQQIASAVIASNMNLNVQQQQQQLQKQKARFQTNLDALEQFATTDELKGLISTLRLRWTNYQSILSGNITQQNIPTLLEKSNALLANCTQIANHIQEGNSTLIRINQVAQMRTLTEQTLLFILIERWGIEGYKDEREALLNQLSIIKRNLSTAVVPHHKATATLHEIDLYYDRLLMYNNDLQNVDLYSILLAHHNLLIQTDHLTQIYTNNETLE